jgi:hypothetical protein
MPCCRHLWKVKCKGYSSIIKKSEAYEIQIQELQKVNSEANCDLIVEIMKNIILSFYGKMWLVSYTRNSR